ncbi:ORF6N domain-containing protein [Candidatus Fukatsuia symbiotica]|uniref:KilA-N DNA-binding domain-containing protein n=1 Tax=Candidatus Fukatsuia symbiotica TaxID=1878942 RepID=A0A2U8I6Y4_9GAMM|nr:ORF6N domain-containing protein [Candidatus Fukatsuia symbiotica]AWK13935.1 hypothetical protein CCS41_04730 [Candidatus Fukatsuia symbiotica]MEA9445724.1 ORF6N domain-containing protein [Candidatus Fukatsuia symbiotica]
MPNIIDIHQQAPLNSENLPVITYHKQRVITTELLAQGYGTDSNNIQQNFKRDKERFIAGKHYHKVEGEELKAFRNQLTDSQSVNKHTTRWSYPKIGTFSVIGWEVPANHTSYELITT